MTENTDMTTTSDDADFDKAFAEVAVLAERSPEQIEADNKAAAAAAAAAADTPEAKAAVEKKAADEAAAAAAAAAQAAKTPEEVEAEKKAAEDAAKKAADEAAAAAAAAATAESAEAKAAREAAEKKAAEEAIRGAADAKAAREALVAPYVPDEAEAAALAKFKQEFPGEYVAVEARLKSMDKAVNAKVATAIEEVMATLAPRVAAVETTATDVAFERHMQALHTAHSDYDAVIPKVKAWIDTQPAYLKPAMQAAYDRGTTQDVIALVADFKKATGTMAVDPVVAAAEAKAQAEAKAKADAAAAARAEAANLEPVATRRTAAAPKGRADPNDFDGAFEEAAAAHEATKRA